MKDGIYVQEIRTKISNDWAALLSDCRQEVLASENKHTKHGTLYGYSSGCRGPLCRWAQRTHYRGKHATGARTPYRTALDQYNPFLQAYFEFAKTQYVKPPRKSYTPRTVRTPRLISAATARQLHKGRAGLAS